MVPLIWLRRLDECELRDRPPASGRGAPPPMLPPRMGGGGTGSASGSMWLVPKGEKYYGREDQSTELAGEGVTKVNSDGGERPGAKCHDEDRHQSAKGGFCFYFEDDFHDRAGDGPADDEGTLERRG